MSRISIIFTYNNLTNRPTMTNLTMNELIEEYAFARDKNSNDNGDYWKGVMHTFQKLLNIMFGSDWAVQGTTGYFVFYEGMNYTDACEKSLAFYNASIKK